MTCEAGVLETFATKTRIKASALKRIKTTLKHHDLKKIFSKTPFVPTGRPRMNLATEGNSTSNNTGESR